MLIVIPGREYHPYDPRSTGVDGKQEWETGRFVVRASNLEKLESAAA
jgi:hypothetical protein